MKKIVVAVVMLVSAVGIYSHVLDKDQVEELTLHNIEALASGEGGSYVACYGSGSLDCRGYKASRIYSGYSLGNDIE